MKKTDKVFMAVDQYGTTYHGLTHPRKELQERTGFKHVAKMYVDKKDGSSVQVGYIVGPHSFTLYEVQRWEKAA